MGNKYRMSSTADGKMVKYLLDKNYIKGVTDIFNKVFKSGMDTISAINMYKSYVPQDLYNSLKDHGEFRDDALTAEQFHDELFNAYVSSGGTPGNLQGGRRKRSTRSKRKARKTRSRR